MPRYSERTTRALHLARGYIYFTKARRERFRRALAASRRRASATRNAQRTRQHQEESSLSSFSSFTSSSSDASEGSLTPISDASIGSLDLEVELSDRSGSDSESDSDSGDADDEGEGRDGWGDKEDEVAGEIRAGSRMGGYVRRTLEGMYSKRYDKPRDAFPKPLPQLPHVLNVLKHERPDLFREELRVNPSTFDRLLDAIKDDPIFHNNSDNEQLSIELQLAITLYRFGHSGNAIRQQKVAYWAGTGKGTVGLATRRVITALLRPEFRNNAIRYPSPEEKQQAKEWVAKHSCKAWRDGWCLVDGTLVPLYDRPYWYGESYFDRKCNYSLNVQIVSLPNLQIIDIGYGHTGSTHDSTAWEQTHLAQNHDTVLEDGEFIWADSAYPIAVWLVAPYKKPESEMPNNEKFNNGVSRVRIRSEHAIGFLKGRFQSLKSLRINIKDEATHRYATYWIVACIAVHAFALQCEAEERGEDADEDAVDADPFIDDGLSTDSSDAEDNARRMPVRQQYYGTRLQAAKQRRENLKEALFHAKEWRARRRARYSP